MDAALVLKLYGPFSWSFFFFVNLEPMSLPVDYIKLFSYNPIRKLCSDEQLKTLTSNQNPPDFKELEHLNANVQLDANTVIVNRP